MSPWTKLISPLWNICRIMLGCRTRSWRTGWGWRRPAAWNGCGGSTAAGVFRGFHAEVDPEALGHSLQAMITVRLRRHARRDVVAFRAHLLGLPEVLAIFHVGGSYDFVVHVAVRDSNHLRDLAMDSFTARPEVGQMETHFIFEYTRSLTLPVPVSVQGSGS